MKALAALALSLFATVAHAEVDLLLMGHSWHFGSGATNMNGNNFGGGLEYRSDRGWFAGGLTYRDSFRKTAYAGYLGYQYTFPIKGEWNGFVAARVGYMNGSGFHGPMIIPTAGIEYKRVAIEVLVIPRVSAQTMTVVGVFARVKF